MSYLPELRGSLVSAAERAAGAPATGRRSRRPRIGLHSIPLAFGLAVAGAIVVVAFTQLRHGPASQGPAAPTTAAAGGRQGLLATLGVLRRPQTASDLHSQTLRMFIAPVRVGGSSFGGTPDRALIRRAGTTPWGTPIFLVPGVVKGPREPGWYSYPPPARLATTRSERLGLADGSGGTCCASAAEIQRSGLKPLELAARPSARTRIVMIVPDGVAQVTFILPRQPDPSDARAPIYPEPLAVSAPVNNNVVAVQLPRRCCQRPIPEIWRDAAGHVIKRIGRQLTAVEVVTPPQPGPETPRSRAAQRDPSTPNRVWVTPSTGGPHTNFLMHFRNLLNEATYAYHLAGPHCPSITVAAGAGGGPSGLRGRVFTAGVGGGTWCPGTYHLSISVMANPGARPHKPFGTATFTVHP